MQLVERFGEDFVVDVLVRYPVLNRSAAVPSLDDAVRQNSQSLIRNVKQYSRDHTLYWLKRQLIEVFQFCGCFKAMDEYQIRQCAELILSDDIFCTVTLSEFLQFCERFKMARYSTFFNTSNPNPQDFFKAFRAFWRDLQDARGRVIREQEEEREKSQPKGITWEEYCRLTGREPSPSPLANEDLLK